MCFVNAYGKERLPITSDTSSGGVRPIISLSYKKQFSLFFTQSTFLTIFFNALMTMIGTESLLIKVR